MPGPYFPGQLPSDCGHYYPDVLRVRDDGASLKHCIAMRYGRSIETRQGQIRPRYRLYLLRSPRKEIESAFARPRIASPIGEERS